jgi:hypothetical protein
MFTSVPVDFGRPHLSSSSTSSLPSRNPTTYKRLIGSEPHSHKPFAPILVFLSQIGRLWNRILWQLSVHLGHPWRIKKTDFTSYNSYTVEDKQTKLGVWMDDSTKWVLVLLLKKKSQNLMVRTVNVETFKPIDIFWIHLFPNKAPSLHMSL